MSPNRVHTRYSVALAVQYRTAGAFLVAYTVNLSRGGLFIEAKDGSMPPVGEDISLTLHVPGMEAPLDLTGRVAWHREAAGEDKPRGFGVEMEGFDQQYGQAVDRLVAAFDKLKIAVIAWGTSARSQLVRYLRNVIGCEILECSGTDKARDAFALPVDLAVIDLDACPDDGLVLLALARGSATQQGTPVIALAKDEEMRSRARQLGAADVVATPPSFASLQSAVLKALARPSRVHTLGA